MGTQKKYENIKVSIVIPVYNTEQYISRCMESIVGQGLENYEIIIVDDGSTDRSYQILRDWESEFPQIKLFQNEKNMGAGFSKNKGLRLCSGKYICFVDSDDWLKKDSLKKLLDLAEETKCDAVYYGEEYRKEGQVDDNNDTAGELTIKRVYENGIELFENMLDEKKVTVSANHYFIRRDAIDKKATFSENTLNDDWTFTAFFLCGVKKIIVLENDLYVYYQRTSGNITSRAKNVSMVKEWFNHALSIYTGMGTVNEDINRVRSKCFLYMMTEIHNEYFQKKCNAEIEYAEINNIINKIKVLFEKSKYLSVYGEICNSAIEEIKRAGNVYIYGTGNYGMDTYRVLCMNKISIDGFIETQKKKDMMFNVPVYSLKEYAEKMCVGGGIIVIAVSAQYKDEIADLLEKNNITNYINILDDRKRGVTAFS